MRTLEEINDYLAICEAKARYCRTLDTKDWDGFRDVFTEDYELDVSDGSHIPVIKGRAAALAQVRSSIETARTAHQVHQPEITLDGDTARAIFPMQDRVTWGPERPSLTGYGHYHERWVKQDGQWRIASLKLTRLQMDFHQPQAPVAAPPNAGH